MNCPLLSRKDEALGISQEHSVCFFMALAKVGNYYLSPSEIIHLLFTSLTCLSPSLDQNVYRNLESTVRHGDAHLESQPLGAGGRQEGQAFKIPKIHYIVNLS